MCVCVHMWSEVKVAQLCPTLLRPHGLCSPWISPARVLEVGSCSLLQGIFPTQGLNPGLPHCRGINYQLSHQGSLIILECVVYPFSSRSSQPSNQTGVSCIAGGILTSWATRKALCARVCLWTVTPQALSMEFSRQEYWSGLPFLTQGSNLCLLQFLYWQADR